MRCSGKWGLGTAFKLNPNAGFRSADWQDQVLTIPHEFALAGTKVLLRKESQRLVIELLSPSSLLSLLTTLQDITDNFPDIDDPMLKNSTGQNPSTK